jgi:hypothetical protein
MERDALVVDDTHDVMSCWMTVHDRGPQAGSWVQQ